MRQSSRLKERKLGIKPTKKTKKISFLKPILILSFTLIIFGILFFVFSPKSWDGKSKFTVASQTSSGDVTIQVLDPANSLVTNLQIPASTLVEAANELGTWKLGSISKLGSDKNLGTEYLKNTIIKSFNFPVIGSSNLSLLDKIRIKIFLLTTGSNNQINLDLKDTNYLTRSQLVDGSLGWKISQNMPTKIKAIFNDSSNEIIKTAVTILNSTGTVSEGSMVGKVVEVMGLNVTSLQNLDKQNSDCKVVSINADLATKIAKIFNCEVNLKTPANNFDVEINLGVKFVQRF